LNYKSNFFNRINCSASTAFNNITKGTFNWSDWIQVVNQPQNTPMGAYLIAQAQLESQVTKKQSAVSSDINNGNGAISYKTCSDSIYEIDNNGEIKNSSNPKIFTYTGSDFYGNKDTQDYLNKNSAKRLTVKTNCIVKTPGTTIATMLGFKSTSEQRIDEVGAALSNGIDSVLSALANQLVKFASDQLQAGVLGKNPDSAGYTSGLNNIANQSKSDYNTSISNANNTASNVGSNANTNASALNLDTGDLSSYDGTFGTGFSQGFNSVTTGTGGTGVNNTSDCLSSIKQQYVSRINSLISDENSYQSGINGVLQILNDSKTIFVGARTCNINLNTSSSNLRAQLIYQNAIENIDGINDSSRNIPNIVWNTPYLNSLIDNSNNNIKILNAATDAINAATSTDGLTTAVTPLLSPIKFDDPKTLGTKTSGISTTNSLTMNSTVLKNQQIMSVTQSISPDSLIGFLQQHPSGQYILPGGMTLTVPCGFLCLSAPTNQQTIAPGTNISINDFMAILVPMAAGITYPRSTTLGFPGGIVGQVPTNVLVCSAVTTNSVLTQKTTNSTAGIGANSPTNNLDGLKTFLSFLQGIYSTASCPIDLNLSK
jgi:hypothetical protein